MTDKTIQQIRRRITSASSSGYIIEALVTSHHLNLVLLDRLLRNEPLNTRKELRLKDLTKAFRKYDLPKNGGPEVQFTRADSRSIQKWLSNSKPYFRSLRNSVPRNSPQMLEQNKKTTLILLKALKTKKAIPKVSAI